MNTEPTLESVVRATSRGLAARLGNDRIALLDGETGESFLLEGVGRRIWELLDRPRPVWELREILLKETDVDEAACTEDLMEFLGALRETGLLEPVLGAPFEAGLRPGAGMSGGGGPAPSSPKLSPLGQTPAESRALLAAARAFCATAPAGELGAALERCRQPEALRDLAQRHGMLALLVRQLRARAWEPAAAPFWEETEHFLEERAWRQLRMTRELIEVLAALRADGIPALVLKGPPLALALYGDLGIRPFEDLDLLVRRTDLGRARAVLEGQGWRYRWAGLSPARERAARRAQYHLEFSHPDSGTVVELHWRLLPAAVSDPFRAEELLARSRRVSLGGVFIPVLGPEDQMLALCAHFLKHRAERLIWLVDIALSCGTGEADWEAVFRRADRMGIGRMLETALILARRWLGLPLPEAAGGRLERARAARRLAHRLAAQVFSARPWREGSFRELVFLLSVRERWSARLAHLCRAVPLWWKPTSEEWDRFSLPDRWFWLYYLYRPARLAGKYMRRVTRGQAREVGGPARWARSPLPAGSDPALPKRGQPPEVRCPARGALTP